MAAPNIVVQLYRPDVTTWANVSDCVDLDAPPQITEAIEAPMETNEFVAPDVQVRLNVGDPAKGEFAFAWFDAIQPWSTDYKLKITVDGAQLFYGFVLPNTIQFNDAERWCAFTAIGEGGLLARTSAEDDPSLRRVVDPNWRVYESSGTELFGSIVLYNAGTGDGRTYTCEILAGDTVTVQTPGGQLDELTVQAVAPTADTGPFFWELSVAGMKQAYDYGAPVTLITPYVRNIALATLVRRLFVAAGLPAPITVDVAALPGTSAPFATPIGTLGLEGLTPLGIASYVTPIIGMEHPGAFPILGTNSGAKKQENPPTGEWTGFEHSGKSAFPVDWRPLGSGKWMQYGRRYRASRVYDSALPPNLVGMIYQFWCYDYFDTNEPATKTRYRLEVEVDNPHGTADTFNWQTQLYKETSSDGFTWTIAGGPYGTNSGSTSINLHNEIPLTCGLDMIKPLGFKRVIFTEPVAATDPCQYCVSVMSPTSGTVMRNIVPGTPGIRGNVFAHTEDRLVVVRRDTTRGDIPTAFILWYPYGTDLEVANTAQIPADFQPFTLKYNPGDGRWYAIASSPTNGARLLSFVGSTLGVRPNYTPPLLFPPSPRLSGTVDLTVINGASGTTYPMMAIFGNQLWWVSRAASGWIAYADLEDLSCAEALAQIAVTVDAFFYVDADRLTYFRSRASAPTRTVITGTSASSTRLDDETCLTLKRTSVWFKALRHVSVTNPRDETIVGEAGDKNFRDTEQSITVESRFVSSISFALAVAENTLTYLGRRLTTVDIEREADARRCDIGRSFTALINGAVRSLQILQVTKNPVSGTESVQAVEL